MSAYKQTSSKEPMNISDILEVEQELKPLDNEIDEADTHDPFACAIYVKEIFEYLYQLEVRSKVSGV